MWITITKGLCKENTQHQQLAPSVEVRALSREDVSSFHVETPLLPCLAPQLIFGASVPVSATPESPSPILRALLAPPHAWDYVCAPSVSPALSHPPSSRILRDKLPA